MKAAGQLDFEDHGVAIFRGVFGQADISLICGDLEAVPEGRPGRRSFAPGQRISKLIGQGGPLGMLAASLSGRPCRAVRILVFDKTPENNWAVGWHQDRTIAVSQAADIEGYSAWTKKGGVCHVEPPESLLAGMVTLRLHLDDSAADNGALQIVPGTHRLGRIGSSEAVRLGRAADNAVTCAACAGDVLAMRLLTLHASARAERPVRRRVLHVDYSPDDLPAPLRWAV